MNILEISFNMYPFVNHGGLEKYVWYISQELKKMADVRAITCSNKRIKTNLNIVKVPDAMLPKVRYALFILSSMLYITALRTARKVDVVFMNGANPNDFPIVILSRVLGIKVFQGLHGNPTSEKRFYKQYLESFDGIICASKYNRDTITSYCNVKKIIIIPYGINREDFYISKKGKRTKDKLEVLFWGRLVKEKGVMEIPEIAKRMPDVKFIIAGTGLLEKELRLKETNNLKVLGYVSDTTLSQLIQSCDICIFPSHTEPFGIMILEAMAYGKPIIASRTGGIPDTLDGVGMLVNPMDIGGFVEAIEILKDGSKRRQLSQASSKKAKEFSWEETAKRTIKFIEGCR